MSERLAAELGKLLESWEKDSRPMESERLAQFAEAIAKGFGVKPDEVAILTLTRKDKFLKFLVPEKLQAVGTIPLTSTQALAARTARDKRAELANNFATARHATVFEGVPLGRRHDEPIQKIMSAPILADERVLGVVQISRKGRTQVGAGPDFSQQHLRTLMDITHLLARFIRLCEAS